MKLYFWCQLKRVTGKVGPLKSGKPWQPSSTADNSDAMGTGQFGDTVEGVYYNTVWPGQTEHSVRTRFQNEISFLAIECEFHSYQVVTISETDYYALSGKYAEARLEAMGVTRYAIDAIKAGNSHVFDRIAFDCPAEMLVELSQLKSNKGAKHE